MQLYLLRNSFKDSYTIGVLEVGSERFCDTLEDRTRDYSDPEFKVYGKTAIPYGTYKVTLEYSPKFSPKYSGRNVPYIHDVPGYTGILIHSGNDAEDTDGCILVGLNDRKGWVSQSKITFLRLLDVLEAVPEGEEITITISHNGDPHQNIKV